MPFFLVGMVSNFSDLFIIFITNQGATRFSVIFRSAGISPQSLIYTASIVEGGFELML
jgi:hypothetical protein